MEYKKLSDEISKKILSDNPALKSRMNEPTRRRAGHSESNLWRPPYVKDCEKIMHCPYYNRYSDKTQVFSFYKNDDITRRSLHVQIVSRIARNISTLLGLDTDLTEAIALGHDIGHPPFGHAGERCLNELSNEYCGVNFLHNLHSVRVLDKIFEYNITLNTLDGILCHNGELPLENYVPVHNASFDVFDEMVEKCRKDISYSATLIPSTPEGCVVRISDLIAYIGKDRQDAVRAKVIPDDSVFSEGILGKFNAAIINNLIVNVVENSYGKNCISLDKEYFSDLKTAMNENYKYIYNSETVASDQKNYIRPMYIKIFEKLLSDVNNMNSSSLIFKHHISYINKIRKYYTNTNYMKENEPAQIVIDYITSMTDDYFYDMYDFLFPSDNKPEYKAYF